MRFAARKKVTPKRGRRPWALLCPRAAGFWKFGEPQRDTDETPRSTIVSFSSWDSPFLSTRHLSAFAESHSHPREPVIERPPTTIHTCAGAIDERQGCTCNRRKWVPGNLCDAGIPRCRRNRDRHLAENSAVG